MVISNPQETIRQLLYDNWDISSPAKANVDFTTGRALEDRFEKHRCVVEVNGQIAGPTRPIGLTGEAIEVYAVHPVDVWVRAKGTSYRNLGTARGLAWKMIREVSEIIRANAVTQKLVLGSFRYVPDPDGIVVHWQIEVIAIFEE